MSRLLLPMSILSLVACAARPGAPSTAGDTAADVTPAAEVGAGGLSRSKMEIAFAGQVGTPILLTLGEGDRAMVVPAHVIDGLVVSGDVVFGTVDEVMAQGDYEAADGPRAATFRLPSNLWPDRRITYYIDPIASAAVEGMIEDAVDDWNDLGIITFTRATTRPTTDYLEFDVPSTNDCSDGVNSDGDEDSAIDGADEECALGYTSETFSCYTTGIGKGGDGTTIHAEGCSTGNFRHEIGHAVGLFHEQSRCDRDNYVDVHLENIDADWEDQYDTWCSTTSNGQDVGPFDFDSMMLYGSGSETSPAMTDEDGNTFEGQRTHISDLDARAVAWLYSVDLARSRDVDGDNVDDLLIGVPYEDHGTTTISSGGFNILYGVDGGLSGTGSDFWDQGSTWVEGTLEDYDHMGAALAIGDIDGDGYADVIVGSPDEDHNLDSDAGLLNVFYGGSSGLTVEGDKWSQAHIGVAGTSQGGDNFGAALVIADYNGDGYGDVTAGVPGDGPSSTTDEAGGVNIIYGSASGLGFGGDDWYYQDASGVVGSGEANDHFGETLASGDFDNDGYADLAIGVPGEDVGSVSNAGSVNVLYGSSTGLSTSGNQLWNQDITGVEDTCEANDDYGSALAVGDFNCDGFDDLAVGVPGEAVGTVTGAGQVSVLWGSAAGLTVTGDTLIHANSSYVPGTAETNDHFGETLASADLNWDGCDDLAIGIPDESGTAGAYQGEVVVMYGATAGLLTRSGSQITCSGSCEAGDQLGSALGTGDWNGDGYIDLAMGAPGEDVGSVSNAGAVVVAYGASASLDTAGAECWYQDSTGVSGTSETSDAFGDAIAQ